MYEVKVKPPAFNLSISSTVLVKGMSNRSSKEGTDRLVTLDRSSTNRVYPLHLSHIVGCNVILESQYFMTVVLHFIGLNYELVIGCWNEMAFKVFNVIDLGSMLEGPDARPVKGIIQDTIRKLSLPSHKGYRLLQLCNRIWKGSFQLYPIIVWLYNAFR